jgi:D-apionolactonase
MTSLSRAVALFGTDEPAPLARVLRAGPLTVELEAGQLRYACYHGIEVLRGVAFLIRDRDWGTAAAAIDHVDVDDDPDGFAVRYRAECRMGDQRFGYEAHITGAADGTLRFHVKGRAETAVDTNRLGFVVLHPLDGVVDRPLRVTHDDGRDEETRFPRHVSPGQPVFDIRALAHEAVPGVWARCLMEADVAFEMEDHRNWTDASFKTYVRPLRLPKPYTLAAGDEVEQCVTLSFEGEPKGKQQAADDGVRVRIGKGRGGTMPAIGLGLPADQARAALGVADELALVAPDHLVVYHDPEQAYGELAHAGALAEAIGARVVLELVLPCERGLDEELQEVASAARGAGLDLAAVTVCPKAYLKSYQPDAVWPDVPALEEVYDATRRAFAGVPVGGGMITYFTELNRKWPPAERLDYVTHTTSPLVHDADDRSVMETLEALPSVIETTRSFVPDKPYRIGPSAIGMRHNPYGAAPAANPDNRRIAMASNDPRQRGLFGAAWNVGYVAEMATGGIEAVALSAPIGAFGIVHTAMDWPQPWFDQIEGRAVYPVFHVLGGLARAGGLPVVQADSSRPYRVASVAYETPAGPVLWLANLTGEAQEVRLDGWPSEGLLVERLDETSFVAACTDPGWDWRGGLYQPAVEPVALAAYAVARIVRAG